MIYFKENVRLKVLSPAIKRILDVLYNLNALKIPNYPIDWTITSINDSKHLPTSKHYKDEAIDMRSKNFQSKQIKNEFRDRLAFALKSQFTVLLEGEGTVNEHFHIQVKKGETYN